MAITPIQSTGSVVRNVQGKTVHSTGVPVDALASANNGMRSDQDPTELLYQLKRLEVEERAEATHRQTTEGMVGSLLDVVV